MYVMMGIRQKPSFSNWFTFRYEHNSQQNEWEYLSEARKVRW